MTAKKPNIVTPGNFGFNDNLLGFSAPQLAGFGLTFNTPAGDYNVFSFGGTACRAASFTTPDNGVPFPRGGSGTDNHNVDWLVAPAVRVGRALQELRSTACNSVQ